MRKPPNGAQVALSRDVSFAKAVDRVQADFFGMPGLELTLPQAVRLWSLGADDCRYVIDALIDSGFLRWTHKRTIIRTGRELPVDGPPVSTDILVRARRNGDRSVGT